jgi:predicted negative regulator of RcsB-dependent stress response
VPGRHDGVLEVEDLTDNEREEQIRQWWSENWLWILGGIALGLAMLWGWQYWQRMKTEQAQHELAGYQSVITNLGQDKFDQAVVEAKALRDAQPGSPYADQSDLVLARAAVEKRMFDEAAQHLRTVMDGSKDPELRAVARARLARVMVEQAKYDDAVALLEPADAGSYAALYHELRGDAYAGKGDVAAARREYDEALAAPVVDTGLDRDYIELKREALPAAAVADAATADPAPAEGAASEAAAK